MIQCNADQTGFHGCGNPVLWTVKAADMKLLSCGQHLHRVCRQMLKTGVEYMNISPYKRG